MCWSFTHHYSRNRWSWLPISICFPSVSLNWHHKDIGLSYRYQWRFFYLDKDFTKVYFCYLWTIFPTLVKEADEPCGANVTIEFKVLLKVTTLYPCIYLVKLFISSTFLSMFPTLGMNQGLKPVYNSETAPFSVHMKGVHKMKYPFMYAPGLRSTSFSMYSLRYERYKNGASVYICTCGLVGI